jgi:tripartite-type tricarboxylate transporter receptor subunit TctC
MKTTRRHFLRLASGALALPALRQSAFADTYPTRPVRILVGQAAGSSSDLTARLIGQWLTDHLKQQFVIDIKPGAAGNIATEEVARATPDGYALLLINAQNTINETLRQNGKFDFLRDIAPVAPLTRVALVMEVHPDFPAKTVPEFIAYAKANPGKINMASAGIGGPQHVAGELFKFMTGIDMVHVPYRGSTPAVTDLVAGRVQVMFDVTPTAVPQIKAGTLRALGVTTAKPIDILPGVPAVGEFVKGYEATAWTGIGAPKGTPAAVIEALNKEIVAGLGDATIRQRFAAISADPAQPLSPAAFAQMIAEDAAKWAKVIKFADIKAN